MARWLVLLTLRTDSLEPLPNGMVPSALAGMTSGRLRQAQPAASEFVEGATSGRRYIKLRNII